MTPLYRLAGVVGLVLASAATPSAAAPHTARQEAEKLAQLPPLVPNGHIDHSGRRQTGRASYYARHLADRKMAGGGRFNPNSDAAASKTLPFGTMARVTNLSNGRSALVTVEDYGPSVAGRVMDVTPRVAERLGMRTRGVVPVVVAPVTVPQGDGTVKLGAGAVSTAAR